MASLNVYCIIVTYNAMKWVDQCLGSLRISSLNVRPVVIDNCSKDGTVDYIRQHYPETHIIVNKENKGFGQANNQGIEYAYDQGATHFFLLNQDAWVYENTISKLVDVQDKYKLAVASPIHLNGKGNSLDYNYFMFSVLLDSNIEYVSDLILNNLKPFYSVTKINAAAWMLSKNTIETVGGFDPIFFHYGEDGNYCQRVKYHKGKVAFVPGAHVHHDREAKGNIKVFKKNSTSSTLINKYSDVNKKVWTIETGRTMLHIVNLKLALSFLFKLRFKEFGYIINGYVNFIKKIPQIIRHRKLNQKIGPSWLSLNRTLVK